MSQFRTTSVEEAVQRVAFDLEERAAGGRGRGMVGDEEGPVVVKGGVRGVAREVEGEERHAGICEWCDQLGGG